MFTTIAIVIAVLVVATVLMSSYKKVPLNQAMSITGAFLKAPKTVVGGGHFVIPVLQQADYIDMSAFNLDFSVKNANTSTQVPLNVGGTMNLNIGIEPAMIQTAMRKSLTVSSEDLESQLRSIVTGQIRGVLGSMNPTEVPNNKQLFADKVQENVAPILAGLGYELNSIQIDDVSDDNGFVQSLYAEDVAQKRQTALQAQAKADAETRAFKAQQDAEANEAEQSNLQKISEQNKTTKVITARNKVEEDTERGKADAAYDLANAEANKNVVTTEGERDTIKAQQEAFIAAKGVEKAKAEADAAATKTRTAADANNYTVGKEAEAEANKIKSLGNANAETVKATGLAEAEATKARGEAFEQNGSMILQQAIIEKLPEIVKASAEAISGIDNLTVFNGSDGVNDMSQAGLAQAFQFIKESTGMDVAEMLQSRANGQLTIDKASHKSEDK